jgi:hypothetical protein
LQQYRELGIRYRVWDFIQNRGLNESYTYFINNQKIHEIGNFEDLDLVVWTIPKYVGNYKFIYQYIQSQWSGPIIFILDIEGGIHNYDWINQSCVLSDDIQSVSNWGSSWVNSKNNSVVIEFEGLKYSIEEWKKIFVRNWKLNQILD